MTDTHGSGPNPLCEVGRRHQRDRHRMRPVENHDNTWSCSRHSMFATLVDKDTAESFERGDSYPTPDGGDGLFVGIGDERPGGVIVYYRSA